MRPNIVKPSTAGFFGGGKEQQNRIWVQYRRGEAPVFARSGNFEKFHGKPLLRKPIDTGRNEKKTQENHCRTDQQVQYGPQNALNFNA